MIGCYPGSFNPPTVAHLAVAHGALEQCGLERVDLVVSRDALGKERVEVPSFDDRIAVLHDVARARPWLRVEVTDARLLVDIARGYDVVVMGADKWAQVLDPVWYGSQDARDAALAALPRAVVAPRHGYTVQGAEVLDVGDQHAQVSSSAVRDGRLELMVAEAAAFDAATGAWSDPARYRSVRGRRP